MVHLRPFWVFLIVLGTWLPSHPSLITNNTVSCLCRFSFTYLPIFLEINYHGQSENVHYSSFFSLLVSLFARCGCKATIPSHPLQWKILEIFAWSFTWRTFRKNKSISKNGGRTWPRAWNSSPVYYLSFMRNTCTIRWPKRATAYERELDWAQKGLNRYQLTLNDQK